ncbi:MAG: HDOD domain-containing protein, partial [Burkholderiales bacterium]
MKSVLLCNSSAAEIELLRVALGNKFAVHSMTSWKPGAIDLGGMSAVLVDSNFTDNQGLDFIMEVNAFAHLPVLIVTPPDDPHCAIEARRIGVFNYLVKTERLYSVLEMALTEAVEKFNDGEETKRVVLAQRQRITDLEKEIARLKQSGQTASLPAPQPADKNRQLLAGIVERLKKGEVNLPSYPETSVKLSRLMRDQAGIGQVARMLEADVAISAKLISVSNSARYRGVKPNKTAEQAISVLGLSMTKNYVDLIANRALYVVKNPKYMPRLRTLWEHSVACAHASRAMAELGRIEEPDEVFTMGMLHDIGKLLLTQVTAEMEADGTFDTPLDDAELDAFLQQHHGFFGGKLLEIWKLPKKHAEAARYHDNLDTAPAISRELLAVHLGNLLAKKIGFGKFEPNVWEIEAPKSATPLKIDLNQLAVVAKEIVT